MLQVPIFLAKTFAKNAVTQHNKTMTHKGTEKRLVFNKTNPKVAENSLVRQPVNP